jgi:hypothetical protein
VGLVLVCHGSLRGVSDLLNDLFDCPLYLSSVHNIVLSLLKKPFWQSHS